MVKTGSKFCNGLTRTTVKTRSKFCNRLVKLRAKERLQLKSTAKPAAKSATKSAAKSATKSAAKSATKSAAKPATKSAAKPATKPAVKRAAKPIVKKKRKRFLEAAINIAQRETPINDICPICDLNDDLICVCTNELHLACRRCAKRHLQSDVFFHFPRRRCCFGCEIGQEGLEKVNDLYGFGILTTKIKEERLKNGVDHEQMQTPPPGTNKKQFKKNLKLMEKEGKRCPRCEVVIFKDEGCSHMSCAFCGASFDWDSGSVY